MEYPAHRPKEMLEFAGSWVGRLRSLDLPGEMWIRERGPGQTEVTLRSADPVTAADRAGHTLLAGRRVVERWIGHRLWECWQSCETGPNTDGDITDRELAGGFE